MVRRGPFPAVGKVVDQISFYNELVDITMMDGVGMDRPASVFSQARNRPSS